MGLYNVQYPNLELLEYKFQLILNKSENWQKKIKEYREENGAYAKYAMPEFDIIMFPQIWGSTITAFDICKDGTPAIGGCAMTKAYTVVIEEKITQTYGIFVDGRFAYLVTDPTDEFFEDLNNRNMASVSRANKRY